MFALSASYSYESSLLSLELSETVAPCLKMVQGVERGKPVGA